MVSVLQRAFACFSCQGVNSRQASKTKESRAKADSRLNLWQPQTKIFLVKMAPVQRFNLKVHIIQWMFPSHHREWWFNRLLISCFVVAFKSDLWIIGVYCELWSVVNKPSRYKEANFKKFSRCCSCGQEWDFFKTTLGLNICSSKTKDIERFWQTI